MPHPKIQDKLIRSICTKVNDRIIVKISDKVLKDVNFIIRTHYSFYIEDQVWDKILPWTLSQLWKILLELKSAIKWGTAVNIKCLEKLQKPFLYPAWFPTSKPNLMKKSVAIIRNMIAIKLNIQLRKNFRYLILGNVSGKIVNQFHSNEILKKLKNEVYSIYWGNVLKKPSFRSIWVNLNTTLLSFICGNCKFSVIEKTKDQVRDKVNEIIYFQFSNLLDEIYRENLRWTLTANFQLDKNFCWKEFTVKSNV